MPAKHRLSTSAFFVRRERSKQTQGCFPTCFFAPPTEIEAVYCRRSESPSLTFTLACSAPVSRPIEDLPTRTTFRKGKGGAIGKRGSFSWLRDAEADADAEQASVRCA